MIDWNTSNFDAAFAQALKADPRKRRLGHVMGVQGNQVQVSGLALNVGQMCHLFDAHHTNVLGEVIGMTSQSALVTLYGPVSGLGTYTRVLPLGSVHSVQVGDALLGRVVDGLGQPIDGTASPPMLESRPTMVAPPDPMSRPLIRTVLNTGIRAIDGLLTIGHGQRVGIFAPAGAGKSTLLGMIAQGARDCVSVIALIGERGREVREFLDKTLTPEQRTRTVVVVATSDRPSMERIKAAYTATAIAEYFRDTGRPVLLLMDSLTRFARALRETGLAAGEPAVRRGFPPSVFTALPALVERAGPAAKGSITAFYTVLLEDPDIPDPIGEEVRSLLDGHIILSQKLAGTGHYPAIDVRHSVSRLIAELSSVAERRVASVVREWLVKYEDAELLMQLGEYEAGRDAALDSAIAARPVLLEFLRQGTLEAAHALSAPQQLARIVAQYTIPSP
ncbi:type III secretion apparatus H+-transporting two-sector ATPase [Burkholderia ubonensis]|uniref:FliI/YscN family ATPase n=1 Tax=Burkholderia ubonensis TaxID=101571 RepID=UPI00075E4EC1|nr:FliI/YscN family ATPase [Burkholderia ubonensis]KVO23409.1 type III secretion apparatus H+-transporting two-sector ATPase [Burkholderia ubonensis]